MRPVLLFFLVFSGLVLFAYIFTQTPPSSSDDAAGPLPVTKTPFSTPSVVATVAVATAVVPLIDSSSTDVTPIGEPSGLEPGGYADGSIESDDSDSYSDAPEPEAFDAEFSSLDADELLVDSSVDASDSDSSFSDEPPAPDDFAPDDSESLSPPE
ncbi:hypothetical protein HYV43_06025 [Candidatus Micrarchaeota archaeon]|nr:hypothetical protein [Candidatus Micrarchaeota archaeon]